MEYNLISNKEYEKNQDIFWEVNPEIKYIEPFDNLYNKGKDKKNTSKIMWSIWLLCDLESPKSRLRQDERREDIKKYFLKDDKFDFEKYQDYIDAYPKVIMTKITRELKSWGDKIEERNQFLETQKYNAKSFEMLDKMMRESKHIWEAFNIIKKEYDTQNIETRARGGREESLFEKKLSKNKQKNDV